MNVRPCARWGRTQPTRPSNGRGKCAVRCIVGATLGALLMTASVTSAHGAPQQRTSEGAFEVGDGSWEGASDFFNLATERLGRDRVQIVATLDYSTLTPNDGVLVLHPEVELAFDEVTRFLRAGGRLAVVDDHGEGDVLLRRFAIRRVPLPARPALSLRDNPELAIATPTVEVVAGAERGRHPVAARVDQVVTNHGTGLAHPELTPILEVQSADAGPVSFAVTGIIGSKGRLLAVGDPSVFINLMLRYPGNRAFAEGLVDYLVGADDWGPRGGRLFVLSNEFRQTGRYGGGSGVLDDLREKAHDVAEEFRAWHDEGIPELAAWVLSALVAVALSSWLVAHAARLHHAVSPRFARPVPEVAQGGVSGRAHVLAAPTTSRALALVELKVALHEAIADRLGLRVSETPERLIELCRERALFGGPDLEALRRLMTRLKEIEQGAAQGSSAKVGEPEMNRLHDESMRLIAVVHASEEARLPAPSGGGKWQAAAEHHAAAPQGEAPPNEERA